MIKTEVDSSLNSQILSQLTPKYEGFHTTDVAIQLI